jgi:rubredoxin
MNKGMFVQCHGCGFTEHISLDGDFNAREKELNRMIDEGWRFASAWDNFVCPKCAAAKGSTDKLFSLIAGKPRLCDGLINYVELRWRADRQLEEFRILEVTT